MSKRTMLLHVGVLMTLVACGGSQAPARDFMSQVTAYNNALRWQRFASAASFIADAERDAFLDEREELGEELRINGYEVKRVSYPKEGESAIVRVQYEWHTDRHGVVHKTTTEQTWERHGKRWLLADETRVRGEEMPGIPEKPAVEPEKEAHAKDVGVTTAGAKKTLEVESVVD